MFYKLNKQANFQHHDAHSGFVLILVLDRWRHLLMLSEKYCFNIQQARAILHVHPSTIDIPYTVVGTAIQNLGLL